MLFPANMPPTGTQRAHTPGAIQGKSVTLLAPPEALRGPFREGQLRENKFLRGKLSKGSEYSDAEGCTGRVAYGNHIPGHTVT